MHFTLFILYWGIALYSIYWFNIEHLVSQFLESAAPHGRWANRPFRPLGCRVVFLTVQQESDQHARHCTVIWIWVKLPKYFNKMPSSVYYPHGEKEISGFALRYLWCVICSLWVFQFGSLPVTWTKEPKITIWFPLRFLFSFQMLISCFVVNGIISK